LRGKAIDVFRVGGQNFLVTKKGFVRVLPVCIGKEEPFENFTKFEIDESRSKEGGFLRTPKRYIIVETMESGKIKTHVSYGFEGSKFVPLAQLACMKFKEYTTDNTLDKVTDIQTKNETQQYAEKPNQDIYEQVWNELNSGNTITGVWAKAFAMSEGDANKTKAKYIELRVQQIAGAD